jgi:hypothetical protein
MDANLKKIKEEIITNRAMRAEMKAIQANADADQQHLEEMMRTNQERIETKVNAIQEKKEATLRDIIVGMKAGRK